MAKKELSDLEKVLIESNRMISEAVQKENAKYIEVGMKHGLTLKTFKAVASYPTLLKIRKAGKEKTETK